MSPWLIPRVIVVRNPPSPASRVWFLVRAVRRAHASGQIVALTGHGPKSFARGYQALAEVSRRHTVALFDPTAVTGQWERIVKKSEPRETSRSAAADVPWVLHAMAPPFSFPITGATGANGEQLPDRVETLDGESILRGEHDLTYVIGPMVIVADGEELEPQPRRGPPVTRATGC